MLYIDYTNLIFQNDYIIILLFNEYLFNHFRHSNRKTFYSMFKSITSFTN